MPRHKAPLELADAFAIKLFQKDIDRVQKINDKTHLRKSVIVRTALSWAFENGFKL